MTRAAISKCEKGKVKTMKSSSIRSICSAFPEVNPSWFIADNAPMFLQTKNASTLVQKISDKLEFYSENQLKKLLRFMEEFID